MITLGGILGMMLIAVILGKHTAKTRLESYVIVVVLVLIEVFFMLLKMYTMEEPTL